MKLSDGNNSIDIPLLDIHRKLAEFEQMHHIANGNMLEPTAEFLKSIAEWVGKRGVKISLSGAWQLWRAVFIYIERMRKRYSVEADIAHWFNVNPFELSDDHKAGLYANLGRVQAQQILNAGNYSPTDYQNAYALTLLATGSEPQALQARKVAMERYAQAQIAKESTNGKG